MDEFGGVCLEKGVELSPSGDDASRGAVHAQHRNFRRLTITKQIDGRAVKAIVRSWSEDLKRVESGALEDATLIMLGRLIVRFEDADCGHPAAPKPVEIFRLFSAERRGDVKETAFVTDCQMHPFVVCFASDHFANKSRYAYMTPVIVAVDKRRDLDVDRRLLRSVSADDGGLDEGCRMKGRLDFAGYVDDVACGDDWLFAAGVVSDAS